MIHVPFIWTQPLGYESDPGQVSIPENLCPKALREVFPPLDRGGRLNSTPSSFLSIEGIPSRSEREFS
jgi:hypothetical protein